jgi:1,4-alpha-glucan branching enzyme
MQDLEHVRMSDFDIHLFNEGRHFKLYQKLGAHPCKYRNRPGISFTVWAPNARHVSVIGDFNDWDVRAAPMKPRSNSGIWETFLPGIEVGAHYKYQIDSRASHYQMAKCDPMAFYAEVPPKTASRVWDLKFEWTDHEWMKNRGPRQRRDAPISIYELHLGSWRRHSDENSSHYTYLELAQSLPSYVKDLGFTHVEFMPIMEHPFYASWGYQITGYFAPTSRYGRPQDLMVLINALHRQGIGVILDWVPSHFPTDEHGLGFFDGTHLYEHADPRRGFHPDWKSYVFNYGRFEVQSFLISNALFWLDKYHIDGLRIDAVASMLYLDYSRPSGEWIPNIYGGNENLEAVGFLRRLNEIVYAEFSDVQTIAEESTAWPMVSHPTYIGGLGFGYKWDMGWMNDTLEYFTKDPIHRKYHHGQLTFRQVYAFTENYVLSLSHDEVVHGKASLANKMPGDKWQKLANLRLLFAVMYGQPGKKLLFMGSELGQWLEWNHDDQLSWDLLSDEEHRQIGKCLADLNRIYHSLEPLHRLDCQPAGFEWVDCHDADQSVLSWLRKDEKGDEILVVANFTPLPREEYVVGVSRTGAWREVFNSDARCYGGSGVGNLGEVQTQEEEAHGRSQSLKIVLPPLGALMFLGPAIR